MKKTVLTSVALLTLAGCNQNAPAPTDSPSQAPMASPTVAATASPSLSASPSPDATATPQASTDLSSEQGISNLRDLIDKQVEEKVLTSREVEEEGQKVTIWSGAEGIRRIDVAKGEGSESSENAMYYYQGSHLFSFGGSGERAGESGEKEKYTFWAGISDEEKLVGPPFQFIGGKAAPYPEDEVREKQDEGIKLRQRHAAKG